MRVPYTTALLVATKINASQGEDVLSPQAVQRVAHGLPLAAGMHDFETQVKTELKEAGYFENV